MKPARNFLLSVFALVISIGLTAPSFATTIVPPGNRFAKQPRIPGGSIKRSKNTTFEKKYQKIRGLLAKDRKLMRKIKQSAARFGIAPVHIVGALVGEHTYNVDAKDRLQTYYVKALAYLGQDLKFKYKDTTISQLVAQPPFRRCAKYKTNYNVWSCREAVWNKSYRGKNTAGKSWPNNRLGAVFFQPLYAGQTFGLGQLNPLTALKVNDIVRSQVRREPKLSMKKAPQIYNRIMEPDATLNYMAAVIKNSIDVYKRSADMDISKNPGITATLYNLGNVSFRAQKLAAKNKGRSQPILPVENYYGWLVNEKISDLQSLL